MLLAHKINLGGDNMTEQDKLFHMLDETQNLSEADYSFLALCSTDRESDIRYLVADVLCGDTSPDSEQILCRLLNDSDEVVRANACDSLYRSCSAHVLERLKELAVSDSYLVRGYAVASIGNIMTTLSNPDNCLTFLKAAYTHEASAWVKLDYCEIFYCLGDEASLTPILKALEKKNYKIRCKAINILKNLINDNNQEQIVSRLVSLYKSDTSEAVKKSIQNMLSTLSTS